MIVLLVEDDSSVRAVAELLLREAHFNVLQARNGEEALLISRSHDDINLMLTDVELGEGMDGIELRSQMLAERPGLPVLVMSGFADNERIAADEGIPFLAKPFTYASLTQRIRETLAPVKNAMRADVVSGP